MSSVVISGDTSGAITLAAPAVAGTNTLTLPAQTATVITDSSAVLNIGSGQIYKDASGNVGIGTSSPSYKLQVSGSIKEIQSSEAATTGNVQGTFATSFQRTSNDTVLNIGYATTPDSWVISSSYGTTGAYKPITFATSDTERMRIDSSGNVGIGTSSPQQKLNVIGTSASLSDAIRVNTSGSASVRSGIYISGNSSTTSYNWLLANQYNVSQGFEITPSTAADGNTFSTPVAVFTQSGNLLVATTSAGVSNSLSTTIEASGANNSRISVNHSSVAGSSNGSYYMQFGYGGNLIGSISQNSTTTVAFNTSSDYRLKENVQPMTTGLATIGALKPVTYDWISDKSAGQGFIAHELQAVIPLAVTGEKDAVDEEGNIKPQGIDYSKIVVHLVAAVQELSAKVDAQAAEIASLKAKVGA